ISSRARASTARAASTASGSSTPRASSSTDGRSRSSTAEPYFRAGARSTRRARLPARELGLGGGLVLALADLEHEALQEERVAALVAHRHRLGPHAHDAAVARDQPVLLAERLPGRVRAPRRLEHALAVLWVQE